MKSVLWGIRMLPRIPLKFAMRPLSARKIALMKKNDVAEVLEVCAKEKIDGIDSAWLRIRTENGVEGYSFGGFLTNGREWRDWLRKKNRDCERAIPIYIRKKRGFSVF